MAKRLRRDAEGHPLPRMQVVFRCRACAMKFRAVLYADDPDPPCPNLDCGAVQTPIGMNVGAGRAPSVGGSLAARATDMAAEMVMQDHGMTNLRDARYEGEVAAPSLTREQQQYSDAMFDVQKRARVLGQPGQGGQVTSMLNRMARGGVGAAGILPPSTPGRVDPIAAIHQAKIKPTVHIVNSRG